jgi:TRAP-type C4-dicarboxylate transport system permease small subunit
MEQDQVWLGAARKPIRWLAIGFSVAAVAMYVYIILHNVFGFGPFIGMYEMIRPAGKPVVQIMLFTLAGAVFFGALSLSDHTGAIEPEPHGFFDFLSLFTSRLAMLGIIFILIAMMYEVISRYVFSAPTLWANELSQWIAALVFLLAGQYAMQQRSHIRIYVIYDIMPRWMQKVSDTISVLLIVGFTFTLVWGGYNDAFTRMMRGETFGTAWDPPIPAIVKPAVLIIITLVAIQADSNLIADWNKVYDHSSPLDDIDEAEIEIIRSTLKED